MCGADRDGVEEHRTGAVRMPLAARAATREDAPVPSSPCLTETGRLEAFSDAVFAIVLTLLVLDLLPGEHAQGAAELLAGWPRYFAFATAFGTVGSIWLSHHNAFTRIRRVDPVVLVVNLGLLLATTLVPWPTALIASALGSGDRAAETAAVVVYSGVTLLVGIAWTALELHLARTPRLLEAPGDAAWMRRNARLSAGSILVGAVGLALAFVAPVAAVVIYLVVPTGFVVVTLFERDPA
jgi:uncharacterized membrane protein